MPLVIGIAGGTGSGKTTIARNIKASLAPVESVAILEMDSYYKDFSTLTEKERSKINYDHPESVDFDLMIDQIISLKNGKPIEKPNYDFVHHVRSQERESIDAANIIIIEGILSLYKREIRDLVDIKIFVDTDSDIRVLRRVRRDIELRGRKFESIRKRYYEMVRPMHQLFVEPSKQWADIVVPEGGSNVVAIDMIVSKIKYWIGEHKEKMST